jgi:hypothetical protein
MNTQNIDEVWTAEDDAAYRPLRNKLMRIEARRRRDPERKTRYIPRRRRPSVVQP